METERSLCRRSMASLMNSVGKGGDPRGARPRAQTATFRKSSECSLCWLQDPRTHIKAQLRPVHPALSPAL